MIFLAAGAIIFSLVSHVCSQQAGTLEPEVHPTLSWQTCTAPGTCTTQSSGKIVLDANWRWVHATSGITNCYTGNAWNPIFCPDPATCATNCALDGADYAGTYGITTSGNSLRLNFVTNSGTPNVGSRVYLMANETSYQLFKVLNKEFSFDVDVSNLPCGLNGALYFSEMDADGGMAKYPTNKAGAKYGTGYCDSQCPRDLKFINGQANVIDWTPDSNSANSGKGRYGSCCNEMDIWEANSVSTAYTPHPCTVQGQTRCSNTECGGVDSRYDGLCDPDGCDFNSYRQGQTAFYGQGKTVDTAKKFTVVTQFITADNTTTGALTEIRRLYVQGGKVIQNSVSNVAGIDAVNSISDKYCSQQKAVFGDTDSFTSKGGLAGIAKSFANGVVLVMSIWDDYNTNMLWLDSAYPPDKPATDPGVLRGSCPITSGSPAHLEVEEGDSSVVFSNIKFGPIGSTYTAS